MTRTRHQGQTRTLASLLMAWTLVAPCGLASGDGDPADSRAGERERMAATIDSVIKARETAGRTTPDNSLSVQTGAMRYTQFGVIGQSSSASGDISFEQGMNATNAEATWGWFQKRNRATLLGYRMAYDPKVKRTIYQAGVAGYRYYPYTTGLPVLGNRDFQVFTYDFKLRPYIEGGASLGRYLMRVFGQEAALDLSSEFYGAYATAGVEYPLTSRLTTGLSATFDYVKGYGPVKFYATTTFARLALTTYY